MPTLAPDHSLSEASDQLGMSLGDFLDGPQAAAVILAALHAEGWRGSPAHALLGVATGGIEADATRAAERGAANVADPWTVLCEHAEDVSVVDVFRRLLRQTEPHTLSTPTGGEWGFDLDDEPEPPAWVVEGMLEHGIVTMLTGDHGSAKSYFRDALMAAGLRGGTFLGRPVHARRFMVIDGENSRPEVAARWRALSITNEDQANIHLTTREARVQLGDPTWDTWLRSEVERFKPDVVIVDSVARCCSVALLDNDSVVALYKNVLVPLVDESGTALLFTSHERKGGARGDRSEAAMGARQWVDQAEAHLTLAPTAKFESEPTGDGKVNTRRSFVLRRPKLRSGVTDAPEHFELRGVKAGGEHGALLSLTVTSPQNEPTMVERLIAACDRPLGRTEIARLVDLDQSGSKFRTALAKAIDSGALMQRADKLYERAEE